MVQPEADDPLGSHLDGNIFNRRLIVEKEVEFHCGGRRAGEETKSLVGCPSLGSPGKWMIKRAVWQVKQLARNFFQGDPDLLRRVEKALAAEGETVAKRRAATAMRQGVGA